MADFTCLKFTAFDELTAPDILKRAAAGDPLAQTELGYRLLNGVKGVTKNTRKAMKWTLKAANGGHPQAQHNMGTSYRDGTDVAKNWVTAVEWWMKAAIQGHSGARNELGRAYHNGDGVNKDKAEAEKWYRLAAQQGDVGAQFNLGLLLEESDQQDEAEQCYLRAADQVGALSHDE